MQALLTVTDVADFLAVAETTVWKWKREGKIASLVYCSLFYSLLP